MSSSIHVIPGFAEIIRLTGVESFRGSITVPEFSMIKLNPVEK
jgi:hypothetical protein